MSNNPRLRRRHRLNLKVRVKKSDSAVIQGLVQRIKSAEAEVAALRRALAASDEALSRPLPAIEFVESDGTRRRLIHDRGDPAAGVPEAYYPDDDFVERMQNRYRQFSPS